MNEHEAEIMRHGSKDEKRKLRISEDSVIRMREFFIRAWNEKVPMNGRVYHCGDFFLCHNQEAINIRERLNGQIVLITGNHDRVAGNIKHCFEQMVEKMELKIEDKNANNGIRIVTLNHYAQEVWNECHKAAWMLFGHSHGNLPVSNSVLKIDVGVDCQQYEPISYAEVGRIMSQKTWTPPVYEDD